MRVLAVLLLCIPSIFSAAQSNPALASPAATVTVPTHPIPPGSIDLGPALANLAAARVLLFLGRTPAQQAQLDALVASSPTQPLPSIIMTSPRSSSAASSARPTPGSSP